jgi:hypothetical protein
MSTPSISPQRLVILACSATKRHDAERMPAYLRYDGPLWRTLRAADPDSTHAKVAVLSARYGFCDAATPIADYDARLTPDLAEHMIAGGMTTRWPRPPRRNGPDNVGVHPGAEIASMSRYGRDPFGDVALVGGELYLAVMRALRAGFQRMGCVLPEALCHHDHRPDRPNAAGYTQVLLEYEPTPRGTP